MPDSTEFKSKKPAYTILLSGHFGSGKTHSALSFPKVYAICFDPSGLDTLYKKGNEKLLENLVWYEYIRNKSEAELQQVFKETVNPEERFSIYGCLSHVEVLAKEKKIETLLLDGLTYFVDMRWQYINEFEEARSQKTGNLDQQAMYRALGLFLQRFIPSNILVMATRLGLNVVMTCHLKRESRDIVEGTEKFKAIARKVTLDSDIAPAIEGSYRNKIEGLIGASLYMDNKLGTDNKIKYQVYCDKTIAFGTVVTGKNRYGLPAILDITAKSLYDVLKTSVDTIK